jgi:hypothetical protein
MDLRIPATFEIDFQINAETTNKPSAATPLPYTPSAADPPRKRLGRIPVGIRTPVSGAAISATAHLPTWRTRARHGVGPGPLRHTSGTLAGVERQQCASKHSKPPTGFHLRDCCRLLSRAVEGSFGLTNPLVPAPIQARPLQHNRNSGLCAIARARARYGVGPIPALTWPAV